MKREYQPLTLPKLEWDKKTLTSQFGQLVAQPLEPGFGFTLGNALRRTLLGSTEGAAVASVVVKGINNEFSALEGVEEDAMQFLLNCKEIRVKSVDGVGGTMTLKVSGPATVTVGDIVADDNLELVNKELVLAHIAAGGKLDVRFTVECGRGYRVAQWPLDKALQEDGRIYLDANFSPIRCIAYDVVKTRVGDDIDYDKLIFTIETDGTETPVDALKYAVSVLRTQLEHFLVGPEIPFNEISQVEEVVVVAQEPAVTSDVIVGKDEQQEQLGAVLMRPIETLELSARAHNCLTNAGIKRVLDLVRLSEEEVVTLKNFGKKSFEEVKARVQELGLSFGMKIDEKQMSVAKESE